MFYHIPKAKADEEDKALLLCQLKTRGDSSGQRQKFILRLKAEELENTL